MQFAKKQERQHCPDKRVRHIRLRIPDIPLCAEEGFGRFFGQQRDPPLDQFVKRAESETETDNEKVTPSRAVKDLVANDDFELFLCWPNSSLIHSNIGTSA